MFDLHYLDICSSHNSQILKKIFGNIDSLERMVKNSASLLVEGTFQFLLFDHSSSFYCRTIEKKSINLNKE